MFLEKAPNPAPPLKVYLETYGCQMNLYDSELIGSVLASHRFEMAAAEGEADVLLFNTCAIRENAHRKIYGRLDGLRPLKKERTRSGRPLVVGILGCMAQNLKDALFDHPMVNLVIGPDNYKALPQRIMEAATTRSRAIEAYLSEDETYDDVVPARTPGVNGWIAIMRGCDNFCTFCVVPYTRGRERCRPVESIVAETAQLVSAGYPQVTLLGQNVNSYRHDGATFADLIDRVAEVPGVQRVRFTSPHPKDFPRPLLMAIAAHPNVCKHVHLPIQAGSDRILDKMNRTYTRAEVLGLIREIRQIIPNVSITTDVIIGFPTETEADFDQTADLVREAAFDNAFIFKYSERVGTVAARDFPDDVPAEVKTDRIVRLFDLQHAISLQKNEAQIGQTLTVMIEGPDEKRPDCQYGKSDGYTTVVFPATAYPAGTQVPVRIHRATQGAMHGVVDESSPEIFGMK
jgi:tRNA-2-methylthio-N6-dimethylallyladenosine synthase